MVSARRYVREENGYGTHTRVIEALGGMGIIKSLKKKDREKGRETERKRERTRERKRRRERK